MPQIGVKAFHSGEFDALTRKADKHAVVYTRNSSLKTGLACWELKSRKTTRAHAVPSFPGSSGFLQDLRTSPVCHGHFYAQENVCDATAAGFTEAEAG